MNYFDQIKDETIILQTTYHPTPHLETEMEVVERLLQNNNKIYFLICKSDFKVCFNNAVGREQICDTCYSRTKNGFEYLKQHCKDAENLHLINYENYLRQSEFQKNLTVEVNYNHISELKKVKYKDYDSGMATASSLVSFTRDHEPDLNANRNFIEKGLRTGAYLYEVFNKIIEIINPDLVILFNGRFIENRPILRVCQNKNITYATHERGGKLDSFLFRINSIPHSIPTISEEMESLWENAKDNKHDIGQVFFKNRIKRVEEVWYSFTKEQKVGLLPKSFQENTDKKIVTIFNSSLDEYEGLEGFGPYFYANDNEGIKKIAEDLGQFKNIKTYVRIHPNLKGLNNTQNRFISDVLSQIPSVEIIKAEDSIDSYELMNKSDIIITFGSTVGVEAAFAGKNVILLGRAAYENLNCFYIPTSHDELINAITNEEFKFPEINFEDALKYGYWNENFGYKYEHYKPNDLISGTYTNKSIEPNSFYIWKNRKLRKLKKILSFYSNPSHK